MVQAGPERVAQLRRRVVAVSWTLGQGPLDHFDHRSREVGTGNRRDCILDDPDLIAEWRLAGRSGKRRSAGQHGVEGRPERVDVGLRGRGSAEQYLRSGVHRRELVEALGPLEVGRGAGDAEVTEGWAVLGKEDVLGLDVPVKHTGPVRCRDGVGDLLSDVEGLFEGEGARGT